MMLGHAMYDAMIDRERERQLVLCNFLIVTRADDVKWVKDDVLSLF